MRGFFTLLATLALAAPVASPLRAATLRADPATLKAVLASAQPGDTVVLAKDRLYGDVVVPVKDHAVPVEIEAAGATLRSLTFRRTSGWRWLGGIIDSPPLDPPFGARTVWRNVTIEASNRIELAGAVLTGGETGVLVTRGSSDVMLRGNIATGLRSDGFNIATATRVSLIGNTCRDFRPIPAIYDAAGKLVKDGTHPDCIQLWSEKGQPPTSDLTIIGNRIYGAMGGITHFYKPELGRDKVYRVRAWNNDIEISQFWGMALTDTPGSDIRFNRVATIPGAVDPARAWVKIKVYFTSDPDAVRCGNTFEGVAEAGCPSDP